MSVSMREMLEAGCHFGHQTRFWNPKMAQYIFGARNKIHIINLEKTVEKLAEAEKFVRDLSARGGKILFVDSKRGGRETIVEQATRAGCCYVDQRWLGGTLTNFKTVKQTIRHLKDMEATQEEGGLEKMSKKEALDFTREIEKLNKSIGGIKEMTGLPDALFTRSPSRKPTSSASRSWPLSIPTTTPTALTMSSRATTTRARPLRSTRPPSPTPSSPAVQKPPPVKKKKLRKSSSKSKKRPKPNLGSELSASDKTHPPQQGAGPCGG